MNERGGPGFNPESADKQQDYATLEQSGETKVNVLSAVAKTQEKIDAIKDQYKDIINGGSSFFDVTGNLQGISRSCARYYTEDKDPEDLKIFTINHQYLERYLQLITNNMELLREELTQKDGAFPRLRNEADQAQVQGRTEKPIFYYVDELERMVHSLNNPQKFH
jgi:hypothetical protein